MFGADNVYEAVCGRDQGLAWYALLGFKLVWSYAADREQHVMYITSA
jgi:hypothetical protein